MDESEFRTRIRVEVTVLNGWIEQGWLIPGTQQGERVFSEMDVARAELINDLMGGMGLNEAGVDVVMDLIDQIHGLRGTLADLRRALAAQDEAVQLRVLRVLSR